MTLQELLKSRSLTSALIVDDAYDVVPLAEDLELDEEAWTNFIDDLKGEEEHVVRVFPQYEETNANELRRSDEFVAAMWGLREVIPDLWQTLFGNFESGRTSDRQFLTSLESQLTALDISIVQAGRSMPPAGKQCGIIFADLFLGAAQQDPDMERSLDRLRTLLAGRESNPPLVILMSRSPLLQDKKPYFRDKAELLGALFRVYGKQDLIEGKTVDRVLERLATHHADAVRVAAFVAAWKEGLKSAADDFLKVVRRLDLPDYCQIREVLLDVEGQPIGSYLLDIFDRLLQHAIEDQQPTIDCAQELNKIDPEKYPAPYISGSSDFQEIVFRSIWQNAKRLGVTGNDAGVAVSFGDLLIQKSQLATNDAGGNLSPKGYPHALIVLTPACDLVRASTNARVLLLGGSLEKLDQRKWTYKSAGVRTPILELPDERRMSVVWDLKDTRMLTHDEISTLMEEQDGYSTVLRIRESHAIELQQRLLADMGRVGLLSPMPFTFQVGVQLLVPDLQGDLHPLVLPITSREHGVCITGRGEKEDITKLILVEAAVDEILLAISKIDRSQVPERSREALDRLQASASFPLLLQRGLSAPGAGKQGNLLQVQVPATKDGDQTKETVALIVRNPPNLVWLDTNQQKNGPLVISLTDLDTHPVLVGEKPNTVDDAIVSGDKDGQ